MASYPGKKQRLPAKEKLLGKKILFLVLILFLVNGLMPGIGLSAFVDKSNPYEIHLQSITFMAKGHAFTAGSSTRKYTFTSTAIFKYTYKGKDDGADVVDFRHEATWSGNTHQLSVHSTEKHGYYFDLVYRCGKLDPLLAPDPPQCQEISRKSNWSGALTDAWPSYSEVPQRLYKAVVVRTSLVYEAMAKSMEPVAPAGDIKSPPGSVLLQARVADDLVPEPKTPVFFIIESKDGKPAKTLSGEEIHQVTARFINGITAFKTITGLAPGVYSFHPKSVSSGFDGPKVYFNVVAKGGSGKRPYIVNPAEKEKFKAGDKVYINALFSQEKGSAYFDYQMKKGEFKPFAHDISPIHNSMADIRRVFPENHVYRVRVAVNNQAFDLGNPVWSKWRYFTIGENFIPGFKRGLAIISPTFGKTYTNSIPIKVVLPKKLDKKTTMTLNWIWGYSAPSAPAGQVPEASVLPTRFYSQTITVKPGVDYAESTMSVSELKQYRDSYYPNLKNKTGAYQLEAVLKTEQGITKAQTWGPFTIGVLGEAVTDQQGKKSGTFSLNTPIFAAPDEGQIFMAPATVKMKILHDKKKEISTRLQYCPFSKDKMAILHYQDSSLKPVAISTREGTTTVTYRIDKPGFWRAQATTGKPAFSSAWRAFKVDTLNKTVVKPVKPGMLKGIISGNVPRILAPPNHAVFQEGQYVVLEIDTHGITKPMIYEAEYKQRNNKFTLVSVGTAGQSKTGGIVEKRLTLDNQALNAAVPELNLEEDETEYRIHVAFAHEDNKGVRQPEEYSPWLYLKKIPKIKTPVQIPQKSFIPTKVSMAQLKKSEPAGIMGQKSINPQPEPPGKQLRTIPKNLVIMPHPRSFRPGTPIAISIKNTPFSRVPFELRYRPAPGKAYQMVKHPKHFFKRTNGVTSLRLELKQPGEYQLRFRANHKAPWTNWRSFQIMESPAKAAALAQKMRVTPVTARMINPQPEPPGKVRRHQVHGTAGKGKEHPNTGATFSPAATARNIHIAPPKIERPRNGQKFLLTGKNVQVQAQITYAGKQKIQVEVQRETNHRFSAIHPRISFTKSRAITTATISLQQTGSYRLRVRAGSNAHWSGWTTFTVDKLMHKMPTLRHPTTQIQTMSPAHKPGPSARPELQRIR